MSDILSFDDTVMAAQEQVVTELVSGKDFRGLGPLARTLVMYVATPANANAVSKYGDETARTSELYAKMVKACQENFVADVLGFGTETVYQYRWLDRNRRENIPTQARIGPMTPQEATARLVKRVWDHYEMWAVMCLETLG